MLRFQSNEKKTFSATMEAFALETEIALAQRRQEMDQEWDSIDEGWQALRERMTEVGITKPLDPKRGIVTLNAGGSLVTFRRSVLEGTGKQQQQPSTWALGNLFEAEWDKRVPRDSDGRIVLDESPMCVKHLVRGLLSPPSLAKGTAAREGEVAGDDKPDLLHYTARVLGLSEQLAPVGMSITGGTTIFEPHETSKLTGVVQGWCPGHSGGLELLYRASRDGWTGAAFHSKCREDSPSTITFLRVKGQRTGETDSVIGGFSGISWTPDNSYSTSPEAFLFMLKDGQGSGSSSFQPMKWGIKGGHAASRAVYRCDKYGPTFGRGHDLEVNWNGNASTVTTGTRTYDVPAGSTFLQLEGRLIVDIETFRVCPKPTDTPSSAEQNLHAVHDTTTPLRTKDDVPAFGHVVADLLMEEEMVLQEGRNELALAKARTTACATALTAVYGPDVAMGKEEDVVELSVRGTRITTLCSTLQACPDSALAARFDEDKWPAAEKDLDSNGRRVIDCKPSVFSKVLDVLRMTKRAAWAGSEQEQGRHDETRVTVTANDRMAFGEFVDMYFPGCESCILDFVDLGDEEVDR